VVFTGMKLRRRLACLLPLMGGLASACSTDFSTETDTATGRRHIYAMSREQALTIAHNAAEASFPDSEIETTDRPTLGYSTHVRSPFDTSTQQVIIHPVTGVTPAGTTVDGFTFEVSGRGTIGAGDINTASFFARLQQDLDTTGDVVDVVRIQPRTVSP
jgi:hypothetical protein